MKMTAEKLRQILSEQPNKEKWTPAAIEARIAEYDKSVCRNVCTMEETFNINTISGARNVVNNLMIGYPIGNYRFFQFSEGIFGCVRMDTPTLATVSFSFLSEADADIPWWVNGDLQFVDQEIYERSINLPDDLPRNTLRGSKWGIYNTQRILLSHMANNRFTMQVEWQSSSLATAAYAYNQMKHTFPTWAKEVKILLCAVAVLTK